ncbi:3-carboxy-cis,cis-muconate cycloisomerase [Rhodococcus sp. RD6.2]|uniref:3-carboxy-cis,cis-muconate cycloisomerase n=1 Tax=Rhodococcus sp. RD6.2 TaxID=260936 RepID=UPI00063BCB27|nr:3-carboxy-cis,cis-muconate cycloisomerase [Rhodococcus sp. RD6.2]CRK49276.1 3-carboxy-cis,cis-muconate cycloisomerase [Rhodococcus sp. RD6.2]
MTRGELFDPVFGAERLSPALSDRAWLSAMLEVEGALAHAAADSGVITADQAVAIASAARDLSGTLDPALLGVEGAAGGNPVIPLVRHLRAACARAGVPDSAVHTGATSQDVIDTALMLLALRAGAVVADYLSAAADAAADLAARYRDTPMAGRTLGQQALPTTFGALAAGWCAGLDRAHQVLGRALVALPVQFGGAAGTLAALYPHGLDVADRLADELGLARQTVPWHTDRMRIGELAAALGVAAGAISKVATDIMVMAATEVDEVAEESPGGSSAMPHKRNPVAAVTARGATLRVPGLVSTVLGAMAQEFQRAAGAWHAEWETVTDLLRLTGGAAHRIAASLGGLQVNATAMRDNLDATGGMLLAERVTGALAAHTDSARDLVTAACAAGRSLDSDPSILAHLDADTVRELLDPARYLGHAGDLVDRVLASRSTTKESSR